MKAMCFQSEAGCDVCAFFTESGGVVIGQLFLQLFAFSYHIIMRNFLLFHTMCDRTESAIYCCCL